jgi:hypothetical protein
MGPEDQWAILEAEEDGVPLLFRFRGSVPVADTTAFPFLISIMWNYDGKRNEGMPDDGTLAMMDRVEDALDFVDNSGEAFLMVVVTGNNRREWIWYTSDRQRYMAMVNKSLPRQPKFPLDFATSEDASWQTYRSIRDAANPLDSAP